MQQIRVDILGAETTFVICDPLISAVARQTFERKLKCAAQGYTKIYAFGGWYKDPQDLPVTLYRVANLDDYHRTYLITWLLRTTDMTDLYVIYPDGVARGHCIEAKALTQSEMWTSSRDNPAPMTDAQRNARRAERLLQNNYRY